MSAMNAKMRVRAACEHRAPDRVPYTFDMTIELLERMIEYTGDRDFADKTGTHVESVPCIGEMKNIKPGYVIDPFGVVWNRSVDRDIGVVEKAPIDRPDTKCIRLPEPDTDLVHRNISDMIKRDRGRFLVANIGFSLFERAWTLCGMENLLIWMATEPAFVHALLDEIVQYNLSLIETALSYPIDCFYFGDDWGRQKSLIMGKPYWCTFILPRLVTMYGAVKKKNVFVAQHSCGDIGEVFDELLDAGLDIYQTFQPEIYDMDAVKKKYGDRLTFWGGISVQQFLPFATESQIKNVVPKIMRKMGQNGGYIAAPTHAMPHDIPPQNVLALLDVFQNQT